MDGRPTWTNCDEAGDYVVPNVLSPRDLVSRPDNMDETVPHMYKSLKLNQRNIFDLIPGMIVIFSDDDFTTTAHSEAAYLAWIRALC